MVQLRTLRSIARHFQHQGAVRDLLWAGSPCCVKTNVTREIVWVSVEQNPETSIRRHSTQLGISRISLQNILHGFSLQVAAGSIFKTRRLWKLICGHNGRFGPQWPKFSDKFDGVRWSTFSFQWILQHTKLPILDIWKSKSKPPNAVTSHKVHIMECNEGGGDY